MASLLYTEKDFHLKRRNYIWHINVSELNIYLPENFGPEEPFLCGPCVDFTMYRLLRKQPMRLGIKSETQEAGSLGLLVYTAT